jgi:hypothetical protein
VLKDRMEHDILEVYPHFDWKHFSYEYKIAADSNFDMIRNKEVLLLTVIHCANYYMSMMAGAV